MLLLLLDLLLLLLDMLRKPSDLVAVSSEEKSVPFLHQTAGDDSSCSHRDPRLDAGEWSSSLIAQTDKNGRNCAINWLYLVHLQM